MNLIQATLKARQATGKLIATNVSNGKFNIVEVIKRKSGKCDVCTIKQNLSLNEAINSLKKIKHI